MGFYNVVEPCVVGKLHYIRPPAAPIEVDDEVAAPLVESGCLTPYQPGQFRIIPDDTPLTDPLKTEVGQAVQAAAVEAGRGAGERFAEGVASESDAVASESDAPTEPEPKARRRSRTSEE